MRELRSVIEIDASPGEVWQVLTDGDVPLALGTIFGLPWALRRTHCQLLTNRRRPT